LKAALLYGIGDLRVVDVPQPEYGPDEVLTKVTVCAVCPTDIRKYRVGNGGVLQFPFNMGHEWVGEVVEVGKDVKDVQGRRPHSRRRVRRLRGIRAAGRPRAAPGQG
jgi:D-arabinose 1-dehydrogenase-like Zn-dependent alcohol dehydrogenase